MDKATESNTIKRTDREMDNRESKVTEWKPASSLPEFTSFQIKVVFNGTNSAYPARLKDFRAIALAI